MIVLDWEMKSSHWWKVPLEHCCLKLLLHPNFQGTSPVVWGIQSSISCTGMVIGWWSKYTGHALQKISRWLMFHQVWQICLLFELTALHDPCNDSVTWKAKKLMVQCMLLAAAWTPVAIACHCCSPCGPGPGIKNTFNFSVFQCDYCLESLWGPLKYSTIWITRHRLGLKWVLNSILLQVGQPENRAISLIAWAWTQWSI